MSSTKKAKASKVQPAGKAQLSAARKAVPTKQASKKQVTKTTTKAAPAKAAVRKPVTAVKSAAKTTASPSRAVASKATKPPSAAIAKTKSVSQQALTGKTAPVVPQKVAMASTQPQPARSQVRAAQQKPEKKLIARGPSKPIVLTPDYRPSENESFMNEMHRAYFREKLVTWKDEIIRQTKETLVILHEDSVQHADIADRATSETDRSLELRARDRQRKLISKIDAAISRIDDGSYGYCEETGEPIGLKRLDARPIATLSLEAQERHERREKVYRED